MTVNRYITVDEMARAAANKAALELKRCIAERGLANFMAATGSSQLQFLDALSLMLDVDWAKTTMYHLDEYVGLPEDHPGSFHRYLQERLINRIHPGTVHFVDGNAPDADAECARLSQLLPKDGIDVAFIGIGENAHLAFNDPPADFDTGAGFVVVELDDACRAQQVHEGWFRSLEEVPRKAITATIRTIMASRCIISVVPGVRKALAVECALKGSVTPTCPASILRNHPNTHLFLDVGSARLLDKGALLESEEGTPQDTVR